MRRFQPTLRPKNRCDDCSYTWHPRGKNVSLRCPNCRSTNVSVVTINLKGGLAVFGVICVIGLIGNAVKGPDSTREGNNKRGDEQVRPPEAPQGVVRNPEPPPKRMIDPPMKRIEKNRDETRIEPEPPPMVKKKEVVKPVEPPKPMVDLAEVERLKKDADAKSRLAGTRTLATGKNPAFAIPHAENLIKLYPDSPEAAEAREIIKAVQTAIRANNP